MRLDVDLKMTVTESVQKPTSVLTKTNRISECSLCLLRNEESGEELLKLFSGCCLLLLNLFPMTAKEENVQAWLMPADFVVRQSWFGFQN